MDLHKINEGIRLVLEGIGEDLSREGLKETPKRVAEMYQEILNGFSEDPHLLAGFSEEVSDDLIVLRNIPFYSMCEHHLLPFFGKVHIAYIPQSNKVTGFSSLTNVSISLPIMSNTFIITLDNCGIEYLIFVIGLKGFGKLWFK